MPDATCIECGSTKHPTRDCPRWDVDYQSHDCEEKPMTPDLIDVYVVLTSEKMFVVAWADEWGSGDFEPKDAVEQCAERLRAGQAVIGRMCDENGVSEQLRWIVVEPRSIELMFTNA